MKAPIQLSPRESIMLIEIYFRFRTLNRWTVAWLTLGLMMGCSPSPPPDSSSNVGERRTPRFTPPIRMPAVPPESQGTQPKTNVRSVGSRPDLDLHKVPTESSATNDDNHATLTITIRGVKDAKGSVRVALFDSSEAFPDHERALKKRVLEANGGEQHVASFADLAPGSYAVGVFHDRDDDGVIKRAKLGFPLEAYGFSNNARGRFGPPSFDEAAMILGTKDLRVELTIK